jgi:peptidoglycan/LPS O-acetylase OafA/YrhL
MHISQNHHYLRGLSWLRLGLALYLILFHTIRNYSDLPEWLFSITSAGFVSTSIFFIVSGYILTYVYYDQQGNLRTSRMKFLAERFFTLYPLHILVPLYFSNVKKNDCFSLSW